MGWEAVRRMHRQVVRHMDREVVRRMGREAVRNMGREAVRNIRIGPRRPARSEGQQRNRIRKQVQPKAVAP